MMMFPLSRRTILLLSLPFFLCFTKCHPTEALLLPTARSNALQRSLSCHVKSPDNNVDDDISIPGKQADEEEEIVTKTIPPVARERDPSPGQVMAAIGTSPRRILLSFASATGIALAANFLGVTSRLLEVVPETTVEATGLDTYFPRGAFKRFRGQGYTFVIPKEWVADTAVELAKVQRRAGTLDYRMSGGGEGGTLPDAAFGPPGRLDSRGVSKGDTNVSVVISKVKPGFSLRGNLGTPTDAAETFLHLSLAPEGSGRTATLISAEEDLDRQVYQFEYDVDRGERGPPLRAISLIAVRNGDNLLTLAVVAPCQDWESPSEGAKLRKVASSFHLT